MIYGPPGSCPGSYRLGFGLGHGWTAPVSGPLQDEGGEWRALTKVQVQGQVPMVQTPLLIPPGFVPSLCLCLCLCLCLLMDLLKGFLLKDLVPLSERVPSPPAPPWESP